MLPDFTLGWLRLLDLLRSAALPPLGLFDQTLGLFEQRRAFLKGCKGVNGAAGSQVLVDYAFDGFAFHVGQNECPRLNLRPAIRFTHDPLFRQEAAGSLQSVFNGLNHQVHKRRVGQQPIGNQFSNAGTGGRSQDHIFARRTHAREDGRFYVPPSTLPTISFPPPISFNSSNKNYVTHASPFVAKTFELTRLAKQDGTMHIFERRLEIPPPAQIRDLRKMKTTAPTKHTPGPWTARAPKPGTVAQGYISDVSQLGIGGLTVADCVMGWTTEECEANARLIAAAPELLEALRSVDSAMRSHFGGAWDGIAGCCGPNYAQQVIANAIAKATA